MEQAPDSEDKAAMLAERIQMLQTVLPYLEEIHWLYTADELTAYPEMTPFFKFDTMPDLTKSKIDAAIGRFISGHDSAAVLGQTLNESLNDQRLLLKK